MFASSEITQELPNGRSGLLIQIWGGAPSLYFFNSSASDPATQPCLEMAALVFSRFLCCTYKNIAQGCLQSIGLGSRVVCGGILGIWKITPLSCRNIPEVPGQSIKEKPTVSRTKS